MSKEPANPLFQPIKLASLIAKNRVAMAPMVTNFASPEDEVTDRQIKYYVERARGGVGTIIVEASHIRQEVRITSRQIGSYDDRFIPGLSRLASSIKSEGALAILQLIHGGPKVLSGSGIRSESASPVAIRIGEVPRRLTVTELHQIRRAFVTAASRAQRSGFDGVELHAAHLYLLSAFISSFTNKRTDAYGGSLMNRTRFIREIIEEMKSELGAGWLICVRMNACEDLQPGLTLEEGQEVAKILAKAGVDALHISAYTLPINKNITGMVNIRVGAIPLKNSPPGPLLKHAAAIRQTVNVPVIAVGKLDDPELAARALMDGKSDMIALGRQLLCDPYWSSKVEEGRPGEIVHCNYCNACHTRQQHGEDIRCAKNLNLFGEPTYKRPQRRNR